MNAEEMKSDFQTTRTNARKPIEFKRSNKVRREKYILLMKERNVKQRGRKRQHRKKTEKANSRLKKERLK